MLQITSSKYFEITNRTPDFSIPNFSFEEVQEFLNNLGYDIIVHEAKAIVHTKECDPGGGVRYTNARMGVAQDVLAIKPGTPLPEFLDKDGIQHLLRVVFTKEIKKKLLS